MVLAVVDLATGVAYLMDWDALIAGPFEWGGPNIYVALPFLLPGISTVVLAIVLQLTRSPRAAGVRAAVSIIHVALGAVLLVSGATSSYGQCDGGCAVIAAGDWFLIIPGIALAVLGALSLAWLRFRP